MSSYENAAVYDCIDSECLSCESPAEAIEKRLECFFKPGCDVSQIIAKLGPITVTGYAHETPPTTWAADQAFLLAEQAAENWHDEYGDPDGHVTETSDEAVKHAADAIETAIREMLAGARVWHCSPCGKRTYSPAEVEMMMREHMPSWFTGMP